ncbi:hypothetical protein HBI56_000840 [Parastagonospora nodorum]|nr:hypothetical protein HBH92_001610 [Parastagonospora nodorum]KAH4455916.1 hypothetical protein HBH93_001610 [Parastagonospora nodorum]KAH4468495.1 hypothetical protein HBH91_021000 [Parastagonospora nodorum]KAH4516138.1 hypothetical protein HBH89_022340 [Parastagonospora nodorum]KAH4553769.1 hypothetical protein HBH85_014390 [Parastagonospora nodorum]
MSQPPAGDQQPISNPKRPREGESYEPYKRAQGLEYPDMGVRVEDNAYPQRDTTQEMLPNLPSWNKGPLRMDDQLPRTAMPISDVSADRSKELEQESNNVEMQKQHVQRPQAQTVRRTKTKTPMAYARPDPQPLIQVQPIHAAHPHTPYQSQVLQDSLPTPAITPRRKPKTKGPAGKPAQAEGPYTAQMAPRNSVNEPALPNVDAQQIQQQLQQYQQHQQHQQNPLQSVYVHQHTYDTRFQNGHLQQQTPLHQQVRGQEQLYQQPFYGQQPAMGMYALPKITSSQLPVVQTNSRQHQMPGAAKSQEKVAETAADGPRGPISAASYEPFRQSNQSKWLAIAWKALTLPKLDVLPGISVQHRLFIGPEEQLVVPTFVLKMRGLDSQSRLEAWIKITKLGRSFYTTFPKDSQWENAWADILQFSQKMLTQERQFYNWVERIDPAEKMRIFNERALHIRVEPILADPWNSEWTDPEMSEFARQKPYVAAAVSPVYISKPPINQAGVHTQILYAQDGSRVDSPTSIQAAPRHLLASAPFQSPPMHEQSTFQDPRLAPTPQASGHPRALSFADQTPRQTKPVPTVLHSPASSRKRKSGANKKESASNKKLQTDRGQGDQMQQKMAPWLKELEKTYLANQAEIDVYYMENNELNMRNLSDHFSDKMRTWNGQPEAPELSASASQQIPDNIQQGPTSHAHFPEVEPAQPGQYNVEEEMIAEGAAQAYIVDLKRGTILPPTQSQMQSDARRPRAHYSAPQAQKFAPNPLVQAWPGTVTAQNFVAQGKVAPLQTAPVMQTGGLQQTIQPTAQQSQQQPTQQSPTSPIDTTHDVCHVTPSSQPVPDPVNTIPQATPPQHKKPTPVFNPTQEAQKTVYRQMLARNAALDKRLELPESERIVVGGIDIAALLDAGTDMMKIVKQITPFMKEAEPVIEQPELPKDTTEQVGAEIDPPAVAPTFINAPEHGWNNVEVIDETDVRFWPGMDNIDDVYWAEKGRNAFIGETKAERDEWEAHVATEYQREMEKLDEMFGTDSYIGDF